MSRSDPARLLTPALAAFAVSAGVTAAAGAALALLRWRRPAADAVVAGLCASYVNAANPGIPVAAYVLDDVSAVAPVLLFQVLRMAPLALAVLDARGGHPAGTGGGPDSGRNGERRRLRRLALLPTRNPIMIGPAAGIALAVVGRRW